MQVFIFRHAERMHAHSEDPPLSDRGHRQAKELVEWVRSGKISSPQKILCSPKVRAIQTFEPLATEAKVPLQISADLNERQSSEHADVFSKRVKKYIDYLSQLQGVVFVVSHLDWIEEALIHIPSDTNLNIPAYQSWSAGQSLEFEIIDGLWTHCQLRRLS